MLHDGGNHCDVELVELRSVPAPSFGDQGKKHNLLKPPDPDNDDLLSKSEKIRKRMMVSLSNSCWRRELSSSYVCGKMSEKDIHPKSNTGQRGECADYG